MMATHSVVRRDSRLGSAMSDLPAQPIQEEAATSFGTRLTGREVESRLWMIFLIIRKVAGMMLDDNLGIYRLIVSDDDLPARARAKEGHMQPTKSLSLCIGSNFVTLTFIQYCTYRSFILENFCYHIKFVYKHSRLFDKVGKMLNYHTWLWIFLYMIDRYRLFFLLSIILFRMHMIKLNEIQVDFLEMSHIGIHFSRKLNVV